MVCGGFSCSKNSLAALNVLYIFVSFILIGVAAYGRAVAIVTSLTLIGSIIACGVFLFLVAVVGLIGAVRHHQVLLFFYMIILFLLFLLQFSLACACLAVNSNQRDDLFRKGWKLSSNQTRAEVQFNFNCCGLEDQSLNSSDPAGHPSCHDLVCCSNPESPHTCCSDDTANATKDEGECPCSTCLDSLKPEIKSAFSITGGIGLFFSFTEIIGVWLALRYRNQKDPRANPSAFL
ncbi:hypothetical protein ScPMuIL_012082 [Solemya velum]